MVAKLTSKLLTAALGSNDSGSLALDFSKHSSLILQFHLIIDALRKLVPIEVLEL